MQIRRTKAQSQPGQIDEFARRRRASIAPHVLALPGLRRVYQCANRDANTIMTIHLWDAPPGREAEEIHDRRWFRDQVHDLLGGETVAEAYEMLTEA